MRKLIFLFILLFCVLSVKSQVSYVVDYEGKIYQIDINNHCSLTYITECNIRYATDIAIDASGLMYICTYDSLFSVDINNPAAGCTFLGEFPVSNGITGLVVGPDGNVYGSGSGLTKYDPITHTFTLIGRFPAGVTSAGDLVVYNNKIYMAASNGAIYEINTDTPGASTLFFQLNVHAIFGMLVVNTRCYNDPTVKSRLIAFGKTSSDVSNAYLVDMDNKVVFPDYCAPNIGINGAASVNTTLLIGDEIRISSVSVKAPKCQQIPEGEINITMEPGSSNIYSFSLDNQPDISSGNFTGLSAGNHTIRIKNQTGCYIDTTITITSPNNECIEELFVPSAFTPNNDGLNDIFKAISSYPLAKFKMTIYNRWGQLVYQSDNVDNGWDGRFLSKQQPVSVYIWTIEYTFFDNKSGVLKGAVTLIR